MDLVLLLIILLLLFGGGGGLWWGFGAGWGMGPIGLIIPRHHRSHRAGWIPGPQGPAAISRRTLGGLLLACVLEKQQRAAGHL